MISTLPVPKDGLLSDLNVYKWSRFFSPVWKSSLGIRYLYILKCIQVDKHIRRLDSDLARFEAELKEKALESTSESTSN